MTQGIDQILQDFPFLDNRVVVQEPYLYDVLKEIRNVQNPVQKGKATRLATRDVLKTSREIKLPYTPARDKNMDYLVDLALQRYPEHIGRLITFSFSFEQNTKKLSFKEEDEFYIDMKESDVERLRKIRDEQSLKNLLGLVASFRVFNLGKLAKGLKNRKDFARVVNLGLGKSLFTFKTYFMENGRNEISEDLCFHANNYEGVQRTLNTGRINSLLEKHSDSVKKALKKFGILNHDFSDYRDPRLEYILNVLLNDLRSSISVNEYIEIRNFASLRECLIKVDKILDPARIHAHEVVSAIQEGQLVSITDIASTSLQLSVDLVSKWASEENLLENKIFSFNHDQARMFVPVDKLASQFRECHDLLRNKPETVAAMSQTQKELLKRKADTLHDAGRQILGSAKFSRLFESAENIDAFKTLLDDYDQYLQELAMRNQSRHAVPEGDKKGIISRLLGFFGSLFGGSSRKQNSGSTQSETSTGSSDASSSGASNRPVNLTKDARQILSKILQRKEEVIPLSDYLVLNRENDAIIDSIITDLRNGEVKIVVPIYNARDVLYPKRSAKLLIADIEYLIIPANVIKAPEFISRFVDSIVGYKLKEDIIGSKALIAIERYLKTVHRQKRAIMMKKEMKQ